MPPAPARADEVTIRPATSADCDDVWRWRNDADARAASFDAREIGLEDHRAWFARALADPGRRLWIAVVRGAPAGVLRVDRGADGGVVSIAVAPEWRGRGVGTAALGALAARAFAECGVDRLVAEVKRDNPASQRAFERAGFHVIDETPGALRLERRDGGPAARLEALWRGDFGRAYTERNAGKGGQRGRFWQCLLDARPARTVLEVGCNVGLNLRFIAPRVPRAVGIDVNEYPLPKLAAAVPGVRVAAASGRALPFRDRAFDLVFTMGVLIHVPPAELGTVMAEIVRCSGRWILCGEYFAESLTEVFYRGQPGALFKLDFGARYATGHADLRLVDRGRLGEDDGWDDVTYWLFERAPAGGDRR